MGNRCVGRLVVAATGRSARTTRAATAARAAMNLRAASSRRPIVSGSNMSRIAMARTIGTRSTGVVFTNVTGAIGTRSTGVIFTTVTDAVGTRPTSMVFRTVPASARSATRTTMNLGAASSPRRPVIPGGDMIRPTMAGWPTVTRSAMVSSVDVRPVSRPTVVIPTMHVRPVPNPTVLIATVVRSTSARSNHPSTREHPRALGGSNPRLSPVYRRAQVMITERGVLVISLHRCERHMVFVFRSQLMRTWPRV
jgi:hypothetical protein